ncbi:MAG: geranylgeranylglyceryl/heptaprenylglyceryl phosphate synthase [Aureisphaera sp.]
MTFFESVVHQINDGKELLAVLVDPEKFAVDQAASFLRTLPVEATHIFVGGSTVPEGKTEEVIEALKGCTSKPIFIFPGSHDQIAGNADALLFLSLLSGRDPEYLVGQQIKAVPKLRHSTLEVIPTGYILLNGGNESAVQRITGTSPLSQESIQEIVDTAKAGELMGAKFIYLEAGSGAKIPVSEAIIKAVKTDLAIPLIVGGGIRTKTQKDNAYKAGADMIVMGTVFENEI